MSNQVIITVGPGRSLTDIQAGLESIRTATQGDIVSSGNTYVIDPLGGTEYNPFTVAGFTTDETHNIRIEPLGTHGYLGNPSVDTTPYRYNAANGAAVKGTNTTLCSVETAWTVIRGLQFKQLGGDTDRPVIEIKAPNCTVDNNIYNSQCYGRYLSLLVVSGAALNAVIQDNLGVSTADAQVLYIGNPQVLVENNTFFNPNGTLTGFAGGADLWRFRNNAVFGYTNLTLPGSMGVCENNATSASSLPAGTGNKVGLIAADHFFSVAVDGTHDLRLKLGSTLIDAGATPGAGNTIAPNGNRQQGASADIGAWEFTQQVQAPTGVITSINVAGTTVTITGTTTGSPTSGVCNISPTNVPYNSAIAQGPTALTFGVGTFTAQFADVKVGAYSVTATVGVSAYPSVTVTNQVGGFTAIGATATSVVQDPIDGQVLTVHGTTSGNPTSATLLVPASASNPNGAVDQLVNATLGTGTFTVSVTLPPGNYDAGILRFATAAGTSLPQTGTAPVSVIGIGGNPTSPGTETTPTPDTTAPVMQGTLTKSGIGSTAYTVSWQAATDNVGISAYEFSTNGGTSYTSVGNVLTYTATGAVANTTYNIAVRAVDTSSNKSTPLTTTVTTAVATDTTAPVMTGTVVVSAVTQTSAAITWTAGTDDVAITGYEYSTNGGTTYTTNGTALTKALSGLTASTTYSIAVRAFDAAGNRSNILTSQFTTQAASDTTAPVMVGSISVGSISQTTLALSWQAATDNVAVTGYEYSVDGGTVYTSVGNSLGVTAVNLTPDTSYNISVRGYDAAGNRAIPLTVTARTSATASKFTPSVARTVAVQPSAPNFIAGKFWTLVNGVPRGPKDPDSTIDITFDWAAWLADMGGSSIAKVKFTLQGVQDAGSYATGSKTTVFVAGGTVGTAAVSCRITTDSVPPRIDERTVYLDLGEQ